MTNEKERLNTMLREKKISESDYKLLSQALAKKTVPVNATFSLLINPFQKIAGLRALIFGVIIIFAMSYFAVLAKIFCPGLLDFLSVDVVGYTKIPFGFLLLIYQNTVSWLVLTIIFWVTAKILQQKHIRIIDFFGTVALARFPSLIFLVLLSIARIFSPLNPNASERFFLTHNSLATNILHLIMYLFGVWQVATYFSALKESSGLTGKKLWIGFCVAIVVAEAISQPLTRIFF